MFGFIRKRIKGFVDRFSKETEEETVEEPTREPTEEPVQEPVEEPAQGSISEPVQEPAQEPAERQGEATGPIEAHDAGETTPIEPTTEAVPSEPTEPDDELGSLDDAIARDDEPEPIEPLHASEAPGEDETLRDALAADAALDETLTPKAERSLASELAEEASIDEDEATRILDESDDEIAASGAQVDEALSRLAPGEPQDEEDALEAASNGIETEFENHREEVAPDHERAPEPEPIHEQAHEPKRVAQAPRVKEPRRIEARRAPRPEPRRITPRTSDESADTIAPEPVQPKRRGFGSRIAGALAKRTLSDEQFDRLFEDLEIGLLEANTAYDAVQAVKENLRERLTGERVSRFSAHDDVERALKESIAALFEEPEDLIGLADEERPLVLMLIGVNGSGKTTTAAKLARAYLKAGKRPVLAAADTFRAAAIQQLEAHANALDVRLVKHDYGADPAAVAYDAVAHAKSGKADVVLIDTAGRLHSNENLLKELEKVKRVAQPHRIIFVGEAIAGNDLLEQAQTFNERIGIDGIILTKTDVDDRGGGALSVSHVTGKPIDYLGGGQGYDDLTPFSVDEITRLLGLE